MHPMLTVEMLVDERGDLLRATRRDDPGVVDITLWRDDRCRATFHLDAADTARLTQFLVAALAPQAGGH
jgi:hypothetical protein